MASSVVIVFPLYPHSTFLDFMGPQTALRLLPGTKLVFASVGGQPIQEGPLTLSALTRLEDVERCDVLCVPGGLCMEVMQDAVYMAAIRRLASTARYVTSVCTGSLILGMAGLLEGRRAACHWAMRDLLASFGAIPDAGRVVRDGHILTGGGITAGIDFGLTLAAELAGPVAAQSVQLLMEYAPEPPFNAGRPDTAPKEILEHVYSQGPLDIQADRATLQRVAGGYRGSRA
ncbi:DJ-1/PfpI family protein [Stigmatella aurantiaca]|uniref:ThiJ/PfpI family protein n=1 Tax=Stigmatella aurantiaca (strain DW4/3-1) TaxID=378806 RepID=Q08YK3_STIAD|nr:DJ-1/PfpI family protein [Stigmatella aurantiaca]ADO73771.1 ThiJ/PfpI family protein [Stigmatella aurantiaca DW4/3-1]EAU65560.1 ThiJ/PfpI family protein [Stigmatella aurantiaca DW4/3-1]